MTEYRLQGSFPSTFKFHEHRERADHLSQTDHAKRLTKAVEFIRLVNPASVVDLGCGDGGLLSLIKDTPSWGYDFAPANAEGWVERNVEAYQLDVFNTRTVPRWGELVVMTEVLEHLDDPHSVVEWVAHNCKYVVASSPWGESPRGFDECHIWAWDRAGYRDLFGSHFNILRHQNVLWSQLLLGGSKYVN